MSKMFPLPCQKPGWNSAAVWRGVFMFNIPHVTFFFFFKSGEKKSPVLLFFISSSRSFSASLFSPSDVRQHTVCHGATLKLRLYLWHWRLLTVTCCPFYHLLFLLYAECSPYRVTVKRWFAAALLSELLLQETNQHQSDQSEARTVGGMTQIS